MLLILFKTKIKNFVTLKATLSFFIHFLSKVKKNKLVNTKTITCF